MHVIVPLRSLYRYRSTSKSFFFHFEIDVCLKGVYISFYHLRYDFFRLVSSESFCKSRLSSVGVTCEFPPSSMPDDIIIRRHSNIIYYIYICCSIFFGMTPFMVLASTNYFRLKLIGLRKRSCSLSVKALSVRSSGNKKQQVDDADSMFGLFNICIENIGILNMIITTFLVAHTDDCELFDFHILGFTQFSVTQMPSNYQP